MIGNIKKQSFNYSLINRSISFSVLPAGKLAVNDQNVFGSKYKMANGAIEEHFPFID